MQIVVFTCLCYAPVLLTNSRAPCLMHTPRYFYIGLIQYLLNCQTPRFYCSYHIYSIFVPLSKFPLPDWFLLTYILFDHTSYYSLPIGYSPFSSIGYFMSSLIGLHLTRRVTYILHYVNMYYSHTHTLCKG